MSVHPYLETIRRYYEGCNRGDVDLMKSTFAPDVVHYFVNFPPKRGPDELANYWAEFQKHGSATRWTVDHGIVQGSEAVVEWSMVTTGPDTTGQHVLRGTEWYIFRDGRIAEIRAYYHFAHGMGRSELAGFPYDSRGYSKPDRNISPDEGHPG